LDEPASSEPKLEEIFQMTNPTLSSMDTSVAKASKTLNSMDISSGLVPFTLSERFSLRSLLVHPLYPNGMLRVSI